MKSVVVTGAYVGDDHHRQLRAHLHLGLFADLKRLAAEGLRDVPEAIHDYGVPVEYYFVPDGAFERDVVGDTSAAGLQPISGLHVHKDDLGQRLFRFWKEDGQAADRLEAAVLLENASAHRDVFDEELSLRFRSAVLKDLDELVFTTVPSRFSDEIPAVFGAD